MIKLNKLPKKVIKVKIQKAPLGYKSQIKAGKIPVKKDIQKGMLAKTKEDYDLLKQPSLFNKGGD